jgi:hypothetical protein
MKGFLSFACVVSGFVCGLAGARRRKGPVSVDAPGSCGHWRGDFPHHPYEIADTDAAQIGTMPQRNGPALGSP